MEEQSLNRMLWVLLLVVLYLFYGELKRAWMTRQQTLWEDRYIDAVRSDEGSWAFGWRLEDLEARLHVQRQLAEALMERAKALEQSTESPSRAAAELASVPSDEASIYSIECSARPKRLVHVGPDEFRDMNDRCRAFSSLNAKLVGPHALWEMVPLGGDDGFVGLRSVSNGKFLRVKAPPGDAAWNAPWLLETVSPLPGLAERFQLRKRPITTAEFSMESIPGMMPGLDDRRSAVEEPPAEPTGVMLYSELMRGYMQCFGPGVSEPIRGYAGESVLDESSPAYYFNVSKPSSKVVSRALRLLAASKHAAAARAAHESALTNEKDAVHGRYRPADNPNQIAEPKSVAGVNRLKAQSTRLRIALCVPMTSRGTEMEGVNQSPFWFNLFASFVESIDWHETRHYFVFYLGFDFGQFVTDADMSSRPCAGDSLYDTGDAWPEMRAAFKAHAKSALRWLSYGDWTIHRVVDADDPNEPPQLSLRLFHFQDTRGAPSRAVSNLARNAVKEGADYVYQLNDDTILVSKDWLDILVGSLLTSPLAPNLGVAGPLDTTNERILTHAFVHRTHIDIFDTMFPSAFRNWWSDDWISAVYGARATFARRDVVVKHNVESQKTAAWNRYDVDENAQHQLHDQVQHGFVVINEWLRQNGYPRMPLPNICGQCPLYVFPYDLHTPHSGRLLAHDDADL